MKKNGTGISIERLSNIKLAYIAEEVRTRNEFEVAALAAEPIAIVGMACRLPGQVTSPEELWNLLMEGRNPITEIPNERLNFEPYFDPEGTSPGTSYSKWMGCLDKKEIENFDCEFFSISPREAKQMDPQQRLLLKVTYEAFEDAGYSMQYLRGTKTGFFVGAGATDYLRLQSHNLNVIDGYSNSGTQSSVASGRLAYFFGCEGPAITIDTACSSSLVALHYACTSLRAGDCNAAVVSGVTINLLPDMTVGFSKAQMLSKDGKCKSFDESANGYVRSEGCISFVIKRLSDALVDRDRIHAVIRATAVNNDGKSSGLTVPNEEAQVRLIDHALKNAGLRPEQISYVEAHGTGTSVGDPIEVKALAKALSGNRTTPFLLGSVKSNIGHLETSAGVAGLLKVVLSLKNNMIPGNLHFQKPNPLLNLEQSKAMIVKSNTPWVTGETPRIAALNSFAFSGTNAHALIEEAPRLEVGEMPAPTLPQILCLSARNAPALTQLAQKFSHFLKKGPHLKLDQVCYAANCGRNHYQKRAAFAANSIPELISQLDAYVSTGTLPQMTDEAGQRYIAGEDVDWKKRYPEGYSTTRISVPHYAFQEQRYWMDINSNTPVSPKITSETRASSRHPFLKNSTPVKAGTNEISLNLSEFSYFADHVIANKLIFPGTGFVELAHAVGTELFSGHAFEIRDLMIRESLIFYPQQKSIEFKVQINPVNGGYAFDMSSKDFTTGEWRKNILGIFKPITQATLNESKVEVAYESVPSSSQIILSRPDFYKKLSTYGFSLGHQFMGIKEVWKSGDLYGGQIDFSLHEFANLESYWMHPAILDSCIQVGLQPLTERTGSFPMPVSFDSIRVLRKLGKNIKVVLRCEGSDSNSLLHFQVFNSENQLAVDIRGAMPKKQETSGEKMSTHKYTELTYVPTWKELTTSDNIGPFDQTKHWVIFSDNRGVAPSLVRLCETLKIEYTLVSQGGPSGRKDSLEDFLQTWKNLKTKWPQKSFSVFYMWAMDTHEPQTFGETLFKESLKLQSQSSLHFFQSLAQEMLNSGSRLYVVTCGAQGSSMSRTDAFAQSPIIGFARAFDLEHPHYQTTLIDLDSRLSALHETELARCLNLPDSAREVMVRNGKVFGRKLTQRHRESWAPVEIKSDGTYLITGGLGGLGLVAIQWLSQKGARHVVILQRRQAAPDKMAKLQELKSQYPNLRVVQKIVDLSSNESVGRLMAEIRSELPPLKGVLHAAGTVKNASTESQTWADYAEGLSAKAFGTWNLYSHIRHEKIDFFTLFSSVAALVGNKGQTTYCGANAFLDSFAHFAYHSGSPVRSINFGGFASAGMAADAKIQEYLNKGGLPVMEIEALHEVLEAQSPDIQFGLFKADWNQVLKANRSERLNSLVSDLPGIQVPVAPMAQPQAATTPITTTMTAPAVPTVPNVQAAPIAPSPSSAKIDKSGVRERVLKIAAQVMGYESTATINPDTKLSEMGVDSLMLVDLRAKLNSEFGRVFPASQMVNFQTINQMADYFCDDSTSVSASNSAPTPHPLPPPVPSPSLAQPSPAPTAPVNTATPVASAMPTPVQAPASASAPRTMAPSAEGIQPKVAEIVAQIMGYQSGASLDPHAKLSEMGMDSLMMVDLRAKLNAEFGASIPASQMPQYQTISAIAGFYAQDNLPKAA